MVRDMRRINTPDKARNTYHTLHSERAWMIITPLRDETGRDRAWDGDEMMPQCHCFAWKEACLSSDRDRNEPEPSHWPDLPYFPLQALKPAAMMRCAEWILDTNHWLSGWHMSLTGAWWEYSGPYTLSGHTHSRSGQWWLRIMTH